MDTHVSPSFIIAALEPVLLGKQREIKLSLACALSGGHLLLEDVPGVGKTTLAQGLAQQLGLQSTRIQFTSDLLPSEIIGGSIFDPATNEFRVHRGPIFTQLVIADEINRATPRTQSALLEAMSVRTVSIEGHTHPLDPDFTVIATQNPLYQTGTYPLPESQLDRFTMSLSLGYPDPSHERQLYAAAPKWEAQNEGRECAVDLTAWRGKVEDVHCSDELIAYLQRLVQATRASDDLVLGLSPRAGLQWLAAARAWAFLNDRDHVLPDDIQDVAMPVIKHRCIATHHNSHSASKALEEIIRNTSVYS
jgi:MoxR-like ATPase